MTGRRRLVRPLAAGLAVAGLTLAILALGPGIGGGDATTTTEVATGESQGGRALFAGMGCASCHTLAAAGSTGEFGPNLDQRLRAHTAAHSRRPSWTRPGPVASPACRRTSARA